MKLFTKWYIKHIHRKKFKYCFVAFIKQTLRKKKFITNICIIKSFCFVFLISSLMGLSFSSKNLKQIFWFIKKFCFVFLISIFMGLSSTLFVFCYLITNNYIIKNQSNLSSKEKWWPFVHDVNMHFFLYRIFFYWIF